MSVMPHVVLHTAFDIWYKHAIEPQKKSNRKTNFNYKKTKVKKTLSNDLKQIFKQY